MDLPGLSSAAKIKCLLIGRSWEASSHSHNASAKNCRLPPGSRRKWHWCSWILTYSRVERQLWDLGESKELLLSPNTSNGNTGKFPRHHRLLRKPTMHVHQQSSFSCFVCGARDWSQGLVQSSHVFYQLSTVSPTSRKSILEEEHTSTRDLQLVKRVLTGQREWQKCLKVPPLD